MTAPLRPRTVVFIEQAGIRWRVRVQYPGAEPHTLLSAPSRGEATRAARGYSARYAWTFQNADE